MQGARETEIVVHEWVPRKIRGTMICVHTISGCGHEFACLAEYLAARGFHCIAPDLPGHGQTQVVPGQIADEAHVTRCLFSLARSVENAPVYYLGSSWGGHLLLPVLLTGMCRVDGLFLNDVLLEAHDLLRAVPERVVKKSGKTLTGLDDVLAAIRAEATGPYRQTDLEDIKDDVLTEWARHRFVEGRNGEWSERFHGPTVEALAATPRSGIAPTKLPARQIARLTCPITMIYGSESPFADTKSLATLLGLRANVSLLTLKGGHAPKLMTDYQAEAVFNAMCQMGYDPTSEAQTSQPTRC